MADGFEFAPDYETTAREETGASQETVGASKVEGVEEALKDVIDPELGTNVIDLGSIYGITLEGVDMIIDMTSTSPACLLTDAIKEQTTGVLEGMVGSTQTNWVQLSSWGPEHTTSGGWETLQALGFNV